MINVIYMFYDRCAGTYISVPMLMPSDLVARRNIRVLVNSSNFQFKEIINDLQLFSLGTLDCSTGIIQSDVKFIANCNEFLEVSDVSN